MAEFLSAEWVAALDDAARSSEALAACAAEGPFVVEMHVAMPDGGHAVHALVLAPEARVIAGPSERADLVLGTDLATATALARGEVNAQRALADGSLRMRGDVESLVRRAAALRAVGDVFAAMRDATSFPTSGRR